MVRKTWFLCVLAAYLSTTRCRSVSPSKPSPCMAACGKSEVQACVQVQACVRDITRGDKRGRERTDERGRERTREDESGRERTRVDERTLDQMTRSFTPLETRWCTNAHMS